MPPATKKLKLADGSAEPGEGDEGGDATMDAAEAAGGVGPGDAAEDGKAKEPEVDAPEDARARLSERVVFHTPDTTLNLMQSTVGGILMPLTEGGLQYLLAGAKASVGIKSGRYMFEAKIVENMNQSEATGMASRMPLPRNLLRIGFSRAPPGTLPIVLGDQDDSICFDSEGSLLFQKKRTAVAEKFGVDNVVAVVLNLIDTPNTISLFKDGVRVVSPQPLPEALRGQTLYPTVCFKNVAVHVNFGSEPHVPLPFQCRTLQDASVEDCVVTKYPVAKDGKHEVIFPLCLPDEGTFEWLDWFMARNPQFAELSDRKIVDWAVRSGLWRQKVHVFKTSNDKPDMNFQIPQLDDGSTRSLLAMAASAQKRDIVVMEIKGNLIKQERLEALKRWRMPHFRKVVQVMIGEPSQEFKEVVYASMLKEKQDKADAEFNLKKQERVRKRFIELRQKQLEKARKKSERIKKKVEDEKKKLEEAALKAASEAAQKASSEEGSGEAVPADGEPAAAGAADGTEGKEAPAAQKEEEDDEEEEEDEKMEVEEEDEQPPKVELTEEERREWFRKGPASDLSSVVLSNSFAKFSLPEEGEGFDEIRYDWTKPPECDEYLKAWTLERKLTTRVEDLQPSDWFREKLQVWQKDLQGWHQKQMEYKDPNSRAKMKSTPGSPPEGSPQEAAPAGSAAEPAKAEKAAGENDKADGEVSKEPDAEKEKEKEKSEEKDPMKLLEEELDRADLDIFGVEDVCDIGSGEPLFASFAFEDWALLSLRFEMHLLVHAFKHDCNDPQRTGINPDHLAFYYNKYYKKVLNPKSYGCDTIDELITVVRDTVIVVSKLVESQLIDDLETNDIFVKLTEAARQERQRRLDSGDETAALKFSIRSTDQGMLGRTVIRPQAPKGATVVNPSSLLSPGKGVDQASAPYAGGIRPRPAFSAASKLPAWVAQQAQAGAAGPPASQAWYGQGRSSAQALAQQRALMTRFQGGGWKGKGGWS